MEDKLLILYLIGAFFTVILVIASFSETIKHLRKKK